MNRPLVLSILLAWLAGCASGPSESDLMLELFDWIAVKKMAYNSAFEKGVPAEIRGVSIEIKRRVQPEFDRVLRGLASDESITRADAAFALAFSDNRAAIQPLVAAASDLVPEVRRNAIAALGLLEFPEVPVEPFVKALDDPDPDMRVSALFGLRPLVDEKNDRGLMPAVHAKLSDPSFRVRNEALLLLRKMPRRKETLEVILEKSIRDPDTLVRRNAAGTLREMGPFARSANPFLIELLRDEDPGVVLGAWEALNRINEKDFDRSYATWRDWYEEEQRHFYTCLEHREVYEEAPGECRICHRKLERMAKDSLKRTEPTPVVYGCPEHPEVQTTVPAKCGKCGKELVIRHPDPVLYFCPEHPDVVTGTPARCGRPGCGKDLVLRKPETVAYTCPDHPEVVTRTPGRCGKPGCGKALVALPKK